jgi:TetR/AcrR family transcriptional regulator
VDNRDLLAAEALKLFAAKGYEAVGVAQIAAAAGVTKPTLYHYFGSKAGLLQAILADEYDVLLDRVGQAAGYQGDLPLTLYRLARTYFDLALNRPEFYRLQLALWFGPPQSEGLAAVRPSGERQVRIIEDLFRAAVKDHGNIRGRERRYAATFLGMVNTLIGLGQNDYLELDDELVFNAVHQFMHGIYS